MGPRKGGAPKGWGPERVGPRKGGAPKGWGAQNFALFLPFPATIIFLSFFLLSPGGPFVEFWWCFEAQVPSNVHVWSSRAVVCEPRRPGLVGPPGFHTTTREPKRAHMRVTVFKNTTKIQRKRPTREGENNKNCGGKGKKKSEILGGPAEGGPAESTHNHNKITQHNNNNNDNNRKTTTQQQQQQHNSNNRHQQQNLAKTLNTKIGQSRFGQSRSTL